jgi:hypothetical protein
MPDDQSPAFSAIFNSQFSFGPAQGLTGRLGTDVLDSLITGINEFRAGAIGRQSPRMLGQAMLGAFGWLDDAQLLDRIADFPYACVAFTKQPRPFPPKKLERLNMVLNRCPGFPADALPGLDGLVLRDEEGQALVVGPSTRLPHLQVPALRTIGYRRTGDRLVPLLHAKMVLLGELRWHDEDPLGHVTDILIFQPWRLWIGSANGTFSSRLSLEFGCWQDDPELLRQAKQFLIRVVRYSEDLDPEANDMKPDLVEPGYDEEAMAEAIALFDEDNDSTEA